MHYREIAPPLRRLHDEFDLLPRELIGAKDILAR